LKPDQTHIDQWLAARKSQKALRNPEQLFVGLQNGSRSALSAAITLIESENPEDRKLAAVLLSRCKKVAKSAKRIGITGVPGVGKSTFIESFGLQLLEKGLKIAVLAIDPSSSVSGGSILGDKTRMEQLSTHEAVFIRPSAAGRTLGGVAKNTREAILLCEAAGYDIIIIETVGVGQSETVVHGMVDFFLVLMLAGAGDELQGMKRGIMELADTVIINKADGANEIAAKNARTQYASALHIFSQRPDAWQVPVLCASGLNGVGLPLVWQEIEKYFTHLEQKDLLTQKRAQQEVVLFEQLIEEQLRQAFFLNPTQHAKYKQLQQSLLQGDIMVYEAIAELFKGSHKT
jgi:LAO/AO transport system kinase